MATLEGAGGSCSHEGASAEFKRVGANPYEGCKFRAAWVEHDLINDGRSAKHEDLPLAGALLATRLSSKAVKLQCPPSRSSSFRRETKEWLSSTLMLQGCSQSHAAQVSHPSDSRMSSKTTLS